MIKQDTLTTRQSDWHGVERRKVPDTDQAEWNAAEQHVFHHTLAAIC